MKNEHIPDELLLAWIDKFNSEIKNQKYVNHLQNCDECYLRYSNLLESELLAKSAKPERVPIEILDYAKDQLGLENDTVAENNHNLSILTKIKKFSIGMLINRPIPITALVITVIAFLIFINLNKDAVKPSPYITTSQDIAPISVKVEYNTIYINQSMKVKNEVSILSIDGDTLLNQIFINEQISIPLEKMDGHRKFNVIVFFENTTLLDTVLSNSYYHK